MFISLGAFYLLLYQRRIRLTFSLAISLVIRLIEVTQCINHSCSYIFSHSVYFGVSGRGLCCGTYLEVRRQFWRVGSLPLPPCGEVILKSDGQVCGLPSDPSG